MNRRNGHNGRSQCHRLPVPGKSVLLTLAVWSLAFPAAQLFAQTPAPTDPSASIPTLPTKTVLDSADEQTEQYLSQLGLHTLLAEHLERKLGQAQGSKRAELADRLAETYAQILAQTEDMAEQTRIEAKARDLLASVPEADSIELRLGLARAGYSRLEITAEKRRIREVGPEEGIAAAARFDELMRQFERIATEADGRVQALERQESSVRSDEALVATALVGVRRQRSMAHYLAAWSAYYAAELEINGREGYPLAAMKHLSWMLGAERPGTEPAKIENVKAELLTYEHVARATIAMALCLSLQGRGDEALRWLELTENSPHAPITVMNQVFARRAVVLARVGKWDGLKELVELRRADRLSTPEAPREPQPMPVAEARLVAVLALDAGPQSPTARALADLAVSDLLARNEPGQVLELASAFGVDRFASTGFVGHQVRALQLYDKAREAHTADGSMREPANTPEAIRLYKAAAEQFRLALEAPDRASFQGALGSTRMLLGLCTFGAGGEKGRPGTDSLSSAAEWFEAASGSLSDPGQRIEALWMAIRSLDLHLASSPTPASGAAGKRDDLIDRYIKLVPESERTTALLLRRAQARATPSRAEVDRLLAVPQSDPQFLSSRRQAARMAYQLFRSTPGAGVQREAAGARYIEIAEPLLAAERRRASTDAVAAANASAHARQMMDVLLSAASPDADRAERTLDVLASLVTARLVDDAPFRAELTLRRMQIALARGETGIAERLLTELRSQDPKLAAIGERLVLASQLRRFRALRAANDPTSTEAASAALATARALMKAEPESARMADAASVSLHASAAEAALYLWTSAQDAEARDLALALYRVLMRKQPNTRAFVRGAGEAAVAASQWADAKDAWGTIAAAVAPGSVEWFEARWYTALALSKTDPIAAADLLRQHQALYPRWGPDPYGTKLRELAERVPGAKPKPGSPGGGGA